MAWRDVPGEMRTRLPAAPTLREIPAAQVKPTGSFIPHGSGARVRAELGNAPRRTDAEGLAAAAAWWRGR